MPQKVLKTQTIALEMICLAKSAQNALKMLKMPEKC